MRSKKRDPIAVVLGTRPEIIKLSPLIRRLEKKKREHFLIHTGQHYSYEMDRLFFKELGLRAPHFRISRPRQTTPEAHTAHMAVELEAVLGRLRPAHVLVQGDTNSVLAGALAVNRLEGIRLGHVEAGLRSYDRSMPEEVNRILTDHLSDLLFAPTPTAKKILLGESVSRRKIFMTGNTIVDAVRENLEIAEKKYASFKLPRSYFLLTLHRQENVDSRANLSLILEGLARIGREHRKPILFPMHPRTALRLRSFNLSLPENIRVMKPVGFLPFLRLEASAELILTDSGGLQEEACILRVPCVTLRTSTERPETVRAGANVITGYSPDRIFESARRMLRRRRTWKNPLGDGRASERILAVLDRESGR